MLPNEEPVKLVIWDMDQTFWKGVIAEEPVTLIDAHVEVMKELVARGIMNSICSHNSFNQVKDMLKDHELWNFFVFPEINWSPKGKLIKQIIAGCKLRSESVVFIDDEPSRLSEAEFDNPRIRTCSPADIPNLLTLPHFKGKPDPDHTQLEKFKVLERSARNLVASRSNEQFLKNSGINIDVINDSFPHLDRIHEMINKTAQLNFTKNRMSKEELERLLKDPAIEKGCVHVRDKFGDYGIAGFYAAQNKQLIHFLFSCRVMNLGIEQWLYHYLGFPKIDIVGEVSSQLTKSAPPSWITRNSLPDANLYEKGKIRCLIKGGCDLEQVQHYLNYFMTVEWESEYCYITENNDQLRNDHTEFIVQSPAYTNEQLDWLTDALPFFDRQMLKTSMFDERLDVVVYSVLLDYKAGLYRPKRYPNLSIAFGSHYLPITDESNYDLVIDRNFIKLDKPVLYAANDQLDYLGPLDEEQLVRNLSSIRSRLPESTVLILVNGSEVPIWDRAEKTMHLHHTKMNAALRRFADGLEKTHIVDVNEFVKTPQDHTDSITHYSRKAYKQIAEAIVRIIETEFQVNASLDKKEERRMQLMESMMSEFVPSQFV